MEQTINGTKPTTDQSNTKDKLPKKPRYLPSLPTGNSLESMAITSYSALVSDTPVDFSSLDNYEVFSLAADGAFPMIKVNKSKAVRLTDRQVFPCGSGRVYKVSVSNNLSARSGDS